MRLSGEAGRGRTGGIYYGWVLVTTLALTEITSWGVLFYSFTVFLGPMGAAMGWTRGEMTGAYSLALLLSAVAGVPVGRWLDRHGPRLLMTAGSCAAALLTLAWAAAPNLLVFYLVWAGIGVTMAAVLYEPAFQVVAVWFRRRRGRAITLLTFVAGFASVIYIPLAGWLVDARGWRGALVILALLLAIGTIPAHAFILRRRPEDLGLSPDGATGIGDGVSGIGAGTRPLAPIPETPSPIPERSVAPRAAFRSSPFWWLTAAFVLNTLGATAVTVHLAPSLGDRGYSAGAAAGLVGLIGVAALPGRLIFTPLGDYLPRGWLTACIFALQAVAFAVLLFTASTAGVIAFVIVFGAGFGAVTPMKASLLAEFYGPAHFGSINGFLGFFVTGARAVAPVAVGVAYDALGTYRPMWWTLLALSAAAAGAVLIAETGARRQARALSLVEGAAAR